MQHRVGFDLMHEGFMVVDAVGGGIARTKQEVPRTVHGQMTAVLDDSGFQAGKDVGDKTAEHQQRKGPHGDQRGRHQRTPTIAENIADSQANHHGTSIPSRIVKV